VIVARLYSCVAGFAEEAGEDGDGFEQQSVDAGLLRPLDNSTPTTSERYPERKSTRSNGAPR